MILVPLKRSPNSWMELLRVQQPLLDPSKSRLAASVGSSVSMAAVWFFLLQFCFYILSTIAIYLSQSWSCGIEASVDPLYGAAGLGLV
jgi:hypothetical protein